MTIGTDFAKALAGMGLFPSTEPCGLQVRGSVDVQNLQSSEDVSGKTPFGKGLNLIFPAVRILYSYFLKI